MEWLWVVLGLGVLFIIWFVAGLAGGNATKTHLEQDIEDWEGVYDVKRETDNRLADESKRRELRNKYNNDA